jgi:hypothetical protein
MSIGEGDGMGTGEGESMAKCSFAHDFSLNEHHVQMLDRRIEPVG